MNDILLVLLIGIGVLLIYAAIAKEPLGGERNPVSIVKAALSGRKR